MEFMHPLKEWCLWGRGYTGVRGKRVIMGLHEIMCVEVFFFFWPCCTVCRILVPGPRIEPAPSAVKARSLSHWTAREFPCVKLLKIVKHYRIYRIFHSTKKKKIHCRDFPGGPVVKNPPSSAGDAGSIPGQGTKIPHAAGQLSPCHNYWACMPQLESPRTLEPVHHN